MWKVASQSGLLGEAGFNFLSQEICSRFHDNERDFSKPRAGLLKLRHNEIGFHQGFREVLPHEKIALPPNPSGVMGRFAVTDTEAGERSAVTKADKRFAVTEAANHSPLERLANLSLSETLADV
jgi:hypothetical protein